MARYKVIAGAVVLEGKFLLRGSEFEASAEKAKQALGKGLISEVKPAAKPAAKPAESK